MHRATDIVTIRPSGYTFKGKRYGLTPGCWIVSKKVAREICKLYGFDLPKCGYERILDETQRNYVSNISNAQYRVSLRYESYDHAFTGRFT